uniref:Heat shock 70 kDa protein 14 n=1 Tax=Denticeps clupeoides TaxID=299321 RepID=A0AAY4DA31_9TELE
MLLLHCLCSLFALYVTQFVCVTHVHFMCVCNFVSLFKYGRGKCMDGGLPLTWIWIVGIAAKHGRIRNATNTVVKVKQILGRSFDDPEAQAHQTDSKCPVVNKGDMPQYEIDTGKGTKHVSPEEIAKLVFHKMKETAQSALGSDVTDAVITVPFEFGEKQKNALRFAAEEAGFNVLRLIHEPSAALLAYGIGQDSPFGKRSFKQDVTGNPRAMLKLMNSADVAKHTLSTLGSANCFVDSLYDGMDFECNVSRARFELICSSLFNKSIQPIRALLEEVSLSTSDISKVVLCGGSARIPRLQQMIQDLFPDVELHSSIPPDEVIPVGAAMQAGILVGREDLALGEDSVTVDCCAKDILVKEVDDSGLDVFTVLFPSGTPLPARRQHTLHGPGSLASICLELYQAQQCLAQIILGDLEPKEKNHDLDTVITMKRDGSLHVTCTEQHSGRSEAVTIAAAS